MIPHGFCQCGCGAPAPIAKRTDSRHGHVKGQPVRFIRNHNRRLLKAENNPNWKGGNRINQDGYVLILMPEHPRARGGYVGEHVLVAEKALGKFLPPGAVPHHHDGNRSNNSPSNLVICQDNSYHHLIHHRQRAYEACGHASWRKCKWCCEYDDPRKFYDGVRHHLKNGRCIR
jgi:hypothetical protein